LAALFSKVILKSLSRRVSLMLAFLFMLLCFFFLLIFGPNHTQTRYVVTISTRAALQILYILLTVSTLEQYPTEVRASSVSLTYSLGLIGGLGLPFFTEMSTELLVLIIFIYAFAAIGAFFLRETKKEEALINMYSDIKHSSSSGMDSLLKNQVDEEQGRQP
jgi:hypothetical protein